MRSKRILILGAGILQEPALVAAKRKGYSVVAVDGDPAAPGIRHADRFYPVSTLDVPGVLEVARKERIDGILAIATDQPLRTVAAVAQELDLPGPGEGVAERATRKDVMRTLMGQAGIRCPTWVKGREFPPWAEQIAALGFPVVVKPVDASGSRGVTLVDDESGLSAAFAWALASSRQKIVLAEEYLRGPEFSVEALTFEAVTRVIQITEKATTGPPHFVEIRHGQPARLPREARDQVESLVLAVLETLGLRNGGSHTEVILTPKGPVPVEVGARLGGDFIASDLVPLSTGVDMVSAAVEIALNQEPGDLAPAPLGGAAIQYMIPPSGTVRRIRGLEAARRVPGAVRVEVQVQEGQRVREVRASGDRAGFAIGQGHTMEAAIRVVEDSLRQVELLVDGAEGTAGKA